MSIREKKFRKHLRVNNITDVTPNSKEKLHFIFSFTLTVVLRYHLHKSVHLSKQYSENEKHHGTFYKTVRQKLTKESKPRQGGLLVILYLAIRLDEQGHLRILLSGFALLQFEPASLPGEIKDASILEGFTIILFLIYFKMFGQGNFLSVN